MIHALRDHYPSATICALVNSYNAPVLANNPDIDAVFTYTKAKHRPSGTSTARVYWERLRLFTQLRKMRFDYAILAAPRFQPRLLRLAQFAGTRRIIGFSKSETLRNIGIDIGIPYGISSSHLHEAEDVFRLLEPLGITGTIPPAQLYPDLNEVAQVQARVQHSTTLQASSGMLIGVHISARKPSQRWPVEYFAELIRRLHQKYHANFMLFWSPGEDNNPLHPGDDAKAREIIAATAGLPVLACPTQILGQLIAGLSLCDLVICSDGGAMHVAAGLNKPILCFFGKSDATRWYPWAVPHILVQPKSLEVKNISVDEAQKAYSDLLSKLSS